MSAGIRRQRLSTRDWAIKALLDEFSAACAQVNTWLELGPGWDWPLLLGWGIAVAMCPAACS